jgi:replication-associated recombination protein RarA
MSTRPRGQGSHDRDRDVRIQEAAPLADKLRPKNAEEIIGQDHLLGLTRLSSDTPATTENVIFWGPPG